jgi:hypothetical protein
VRGGGCRLASTVQEMDKTVEELKKVILYRETQLKAMGRAVPPVLTE